MTVRATKFDPKVLLGAPRREPGVPNKDGSYVLYSVSTYSFEEHKSTSELRLLDTKSKESHLVDDSGKCSDPVWLEGKTIAVLCSKDDGSTEFVVGPAKDFKKGSYVAGSIDAEASSLRIVKLDSDGYGIVVAAPANPDGSPHNPQKMPKKHSTGRLYKSLFVRHWDKYVTPARHAIWYGALSLGSEAETSGKAQKYTLSKLVNALETTGLESPIPPFGGVDHFDISKSGIAFVAKDITSNPALHTKCELYMIPLENYNDTPSKLVKIPTPGLEGAKTSPAFSPDGRKLAVLAMKEDGYEADKNRLIIVPDISNHSTTLELLDSPDGPGRWDRSPASVTWGTDNTTIFFTAEHEGRTILWSIPSTPTSPDTLPKQLTTTGSVSAFTPLSSTALFLTTTSFTDSSLYILLDPVPVPPISLPISSATHSGATLGLSPTQVTSFHFPGAPGPHNPSPTSLVHAWVLLPSTFDPSRTYPLALLVHGGPQSAWNDAWSTRWNPAVFAEQGYVVVLPNPTGSTGYGQAFTDAIAGSWGDLPFVDVVRCFEHVERHMPYVDTQRSVALGASYGGFMVNWIQGQPFGRRFRALVTHNGVFSTAMALATEELYFMQHDLGGGASWSAARERWGEFDPARHTRHWETPHLIVHSDLDYRLLVADGLAAFNVLQAQGVESEFLNFPDEGHFVAKPENSLVWHKTVFGFINRRVGLEAYDVDVDDEVV